MDQFACIRFARDDSRLARLAPAKTEVAQIQAKSGLSRLLIRTVAAKAVVGQDWSNISQIVGFWPVGLGCQPRYRRQQHTQDDSMQSGLATKRHNRERIRGAAKLQINLC